MENTIAQVDTARLTTELVAATVAGISVIGHACEALEAAGWAVTLVMNRITVADEIVAQFIPARTGKHGPLPEQWVISALDGAPPVWIVGGEARS